MKTLVVVAIVIPVLLAGCASKPPRPAAEFAQAQMMIEQAERNRAQQFAAADLDRARTKLRDADNALGAREGETARQLAEQAAIDAELALARSTATQAQRSAAEVEASIEALRRESARGSERP